MFVIPTGFEPVTYRLEICCSIQLSYRTIFHLNQKNPTASGRRIFFVGVAGFEPTTFCSQSRRDTGLRYTPMVFPFLKECKSKFIISNMQYNNNTLAVREGFEPSVQFPVRMFSKHVLSATQAPLQL